jgi:glycosyltransferase involved in cell wall biosynthesis
MRFLFLHRNFPGQFLHLLPYLARDRTNRVVFITERKDRSVPGVAKVVYTLKERDRSGTHPYLLNYEESILHGQAAAGAAMDLKLKGFVPDVIFGHTWGQTLFMKDVFPDARLIAYFEWFYHAHGSDVDFARQGMLPLENEARVRIRNSHILVDLYTCDYGICPTQWQRSQFPQEFRHKIRVIHDGIDTDFFKPHEGSPLVLPQIGPDLSGAREIVTYVSRGLEPYRGFPQFMEAASRILEERSGCHIVIVGEDKVFYGQSLPPGMSWKKLMLEKFPLAPSRVHFTGHIPYALYLKVLQASSAHVYLTYPFVLSWSLMEAMSTGCAIVASDTPPVREIIRDGHNGFLCDFFSPSAIAGKVCSVLGHQADAQALRHNARGTILEKYDLKDLLPRQVGLITQQAGWERPEAV